MGRSILVLLALALGALAPAACGGGGESDESRIEATIEQAVAGEEPSECTELETQDFVEQTTQLQGADAVAACEEETENPEGAAESAEVSEVEVDGTEAEAEVRFEGSIYEGQTLSVAMVEEEGDWKIDRLTGFAELDRPLLAKSIVASLEDGGGVRAAAAECIRGELEGASQRELEVILLAGDSAPFEVLASHCER